MENFVDFHMHTCASDGTWRPKDVIENIKKAEIKCFAVTDHDSMQSVASTKELALREGLQFITGVELSTTFQNREYHLLTYDYELTNAILMERIEKNHQLRLDYHQLVVKTLVKDFPQISTEEFALYEYDLSRGGWPSLNYLFDKKVVYNMNDYFGMMKRYDLQLIFDGPKEIIRDIKAAGAIVILAHPPAYVQEGFMSLEQMEQWVDFGIQGMECYSPYYKNPEDSGYYVNFCNEKGLFISGGSDCHGDLLPNRKLRRPSIKKEQLNLPFLK
ncbi:MAG: PHP domain-containing protein [Vallitaleaceae bacterium]|nr:PHP domain-containing protein [Vallitaleaceae bacterium]